MLPKIKYRTYSHNYYNLNAFYKCYIIELYICTYYYYNFPDLRRSILRHLGNVYIHLLYTIQYCTVL